MDCGHCIDLQHVRPVCPTHGDRGLGLAHAILDPEIIESMVDDEVGKNPSGDESELLKAVMTRLRGHGNPKDIVNRIRSAKGLK